MDAFNNLMYGFGIALEPINKVAINNTPTTWLVKVTVIASKMKNIELISPT